MCLVEQVGTVTWSHHHTRTEAQDEDHHAAVASSIQQSKSASETQTAIWRPRDFKLRSRCLPRCIARSAHSQLRQHRALADLFSFSCSIFQSSIPHSIRRDTGPDRPIVKAARSNQTDQGKVVSTTFHSFSYIPASRSYGLVTS